MADPGAGAGVPTTQFPAQQMAQQTTARSETNYEAGVANLLKRAQYQSKQQYLTCAVGYKLDDRLKKLRQIPLGPPNNPPSLKFMSPNRSPHQQHIVPPPVPPPPPITQPVQPPSSQQTVQGAHQHLDDTNLINEKRLQDILEYHASIAGVTKVNEDAVEAIKTGVRMLLRQMVTDLVKTSKKRLDTHKGLLPGHIQAEPAEVLRFIESREEAQAQTRRKQAEQLRLKALEQKKKDKKGKKGGKTAANEEEEKYDKLVNDVMPSMATDDVDYLQGLENSSSSSSSSSKRNGAKIDDLAAMIDNRYPNKFARVEDLVCILETSRQFRKSDFMYRQYFNLDIDKFRRVQREQEAREEEAAENGDPGS
mmetsp:Transcript_7794/g.14857  ORF Transcript_7794/g.14857 Transcript_7794/m.14857 type:complete len:365 (-) Transcript_7794:100-1194(-)